MKSSLENKTVRPGLLAYSSYHSDRHPVSLAQEKVPPAGYDGRKVAGTLLVLVILIGLVLGFKAIVKQQSNNIDSSAGKNAPALTAASPVNHCAGNVQSQAMLVSISQRHLWACQDSKTVYDTPVVTGMAHYAADVTPTGTYHIYAKQTDTTLTGSDSTGNWSDPVHYWMPFLNNQYGTYGLHDATWRPESAFGHISPDSNQASHGCVELPLGAAQWLYNWAQVGTPVTIQS